MLYYSARRPEHWAAGDEGAASHASAGWTRNALSLALSLAKISEAVSMYVPLQAPLEYGHGWPYLKYSPESAFHTAAVLAAALDGCTLPYRLTAASSDRGAALGALRMSDLVSLMAGSRSKFAAAHAWLPAPPLPVDAQALEEAADARQRHASHAAAEVAREARHGHVLA